MDIEGLDHLVLTVASIDASLWFYERVLGMTRESFSDGRRAVRFGRQKINLQDRDTDTPTKAHTPTFGSGDFCLIAAVPLADVIARLQAHDIAIEAGPVARTGALGAIRSVYFRDPDGNLVEVAEYV